jgi:hypothetical protein
MKPLAIRKSQWPYCFKSNKIILCSYESKRKAWMTFKVFLQWLSVRSKRGAHNRKVAIFSDHCPAHPSVDLHNTELMFVPANTISMLWPSGGVKISKTISG